LESVYDCCVAWVCGLLCIGGKKMQQTVGAMLRCEFTQEGGRFFHKRVVALLGVLEEVVLQWTTTVSIVVVKCHSND
jgi:hypothetical protein